MEYHRFIGQVQARARLADEQAAVAATRATLTTLAERLPPGIAGNLAAQLPPEIGRFLQETDGGERFGLDEFVARVADKESRDEPAAAFHARVVTEVLTEAVTPGQMDKVAEILPDDLQPLLEAGSTGGMSQPDG